MCVCACVRVCVCVSVYGCEGVHGCMSEGVHVCVYVSFADFLLSFLVSELHLLCVCICMCVYVYEYRCVYMCV